MKNVRDYIKKHGRHFTVGLARKAVPQKWSLRQIRKAMDRKVWYNVIDATDGDILYLTNLAHSLGISPIGKCVDFTIGILGNYAFHGGSVFKAWLADDGERLSL